MLQIVKQVLQALLYKLYSRKWLCAKHFFLGGSAETVDSIANFFLKESP